jgi:hypothetical protein
MARTLACEDENLVDYFIIATKRFDGMWVRSCLPFLSTHRQDSPTGSTAQLSFVYPPLDDDHEETDFCENVTMVRLDVLQSPLGLFLTLTLWR